MNTDIHGSLWGRESVPPSTPSWCSPSGLPVLRSGGRESGRMKWRSVGPAIHEEIVGTQRELYPAYDFKEKQTTAIGAAWGGNEGGDRQVT